jgi:hypothetical protein
VAVSARLTIKTQLALARYCKAHGLTKTQALERGIALLIQHDGAGARHPAYSSFERLLDRLPHTPDAKREADSISSMKRHLDEKYPG